MKESGLNKSGKECHIYLETATLTQKILKKLSLFQINTKVSTTALTHLMKTIKDTIITEAVTMEIENKTNIIEMTIFSM